jgi:hypothetical protein
MIIAKVGVSNGPVRASVSGPVAVRSDLQEHMMQISVTTFDVSSVSSRGPGNANACRVTPMVTTSTARLCRVTMSAPTAPTGQTAISYSAPRICRVAMSSPVGATGRTAATAIS